MIFSSREDVEIEVRALRKLLKVMEEGGVMGLTTEIVHLPTTEIERRIKLLESLLKRMGEGDGAICDRSRCYVIPKELIA